MRNRTLLYFLVGLLLAIVLVSTATDVAVHGSRSTHMWLIAQQTNPLLWMVDGCAAIILMGSCLFGTSLTGRSHPGDETSRRLAALTDAVEELLTQNSQYRTRIEDLEDAGDAWHEGFENEARRLTEQAFLALSDNIESNAQQLEAITMALRYQRAELKAVRVAVKTGELAPETDSAPALDTIARPARAILPEFEKPTIEPELDLSDSDGSEPAPEPDAVADSEEVPELHDVSDPEMESDLITADESIPGEETAEPIEPALMLEQTVNASSTSVETIDLSVESTTDVDAAGPDAGPKTSMAADEFRRSKRETRSIFRQKRP